MKTFGFGSEDSKTLINLCSATCGRGSGHKGALLNFSEN